MAVEVSQVPTQTLKIDVHLYINKSASQETFEDKPFSE